MTPQSKDPTSFDGVSVQLTENERDEMLDEATHAVVAKFAEYGIELTIDELYTINDDLTAFIAGLPDDGNAAALCFDVTNDKDDAARWADGIAERAADEDREYNAASNARLQYDELGNEVKETRQSLLRLIRELKAKRTSLCDASEIVVVMHNAIVGKMDDIREAREKRNELSNGFSYHQGWTQS